MQRFWKVVLEGKGCSEKVRLATRLRLGRGTRAVSLDDVRKEMAERGYPNNGKPYSRERVSQFVREGVSTTVSLICDKPIEQVRPLVAELLAHKTTYSRSTSTDPYLNVRLGWWKYRKTGRKWSGSVYDRRAK
jgi:hypothetical protein